MGATQHAQALHHDLDSTEWIDVGGVDDIPIRGARVVRVGTHDIGVFRTANGAIYALNDRCPHLGGPLSQGIVHGREVTCPLHNWVISLETGRAMGADEGCTQRVPLRIRQDRIDKIRSGVFLSAFI